jgi:hypothetical protein
MALWRIPELCHERMPIEGLLDDAALNPFSAAVDQAHLAETGFVRRVDVLLDYRLDVARRESMEIDRGFDWNALDHGAE